MLLRLNRPALAAAAVGVQVGAAVVATRFVICQTQPASLALLRYGVGFLCLLPFALLSARVPFERRDLLPVALLGTVQFGLLVALMNYGLRSVPSARAALLFATAPLLTTVLAALLGLERLGLEKLLGVLLTLLGVGFTLGEGAALRGAWAGELALLGSALCGAVCSVLYRPYLEKYPTVQVSTFLERPARRGGFQGQALALEAAGRKLEARLRGAEGTPKQREVLRHIIGIERWGARRVRLAAEFEGGESGVRSPETAFGDAHRSYKPTEATSWEELIIKFVSARQETVALAKRLAKLGIDGGVTVPHNDLGPLSLRAWLRYLRLHATLEGRKIR